MVTSRRTTYYRTREQEIEHTKQDIKRCFANIPTQRPWIGRDHGSDLKLDEKYDRLWVLGQPIRQKAAAEATAEEWMEEHPEAKKRCWLHWHKQRPVAPEGTYSPMRKWRYVLSSFGLPTEKEFLILWTLTIRTVEVCIRLGELMHHISAAFPRKAIRNGNKIVGSEGGCREWFIMHIPLLAKHYRTLMKYKLIADKLHMAAHKFGINTDTILMRPEACSLRALSEYLDALLQFPIERKREQPFKYRNRGPGQCAKAHHKYPGCRYDNPTAVAELESRRRTE